MRGYRPDQTGNIVVSPEKAYLHAHRKLRCVKISQFLLKTRYSFFALLLFKGIFEKLTSSFDSKSRSHCFSNSLRTSKSTLKWMCWLSSFACCARARHFNATTCHGNKRLTLQRRETQKINCKMHCCVSTSKSEMFYF